MAKPTERVAFRIAKEEAARATALSVAMSSPGVCITLSQTFRALTLRALPLLEAEYQLAPVDAPPVDVAARTRAAKVRRDARKGITPQ